MKLEVELVDIGSGNTGSVKRCLERLAIDYIPVSAARQPSGDRPIVLPGVGAFGDVMQRLKENRLDQEIPRLIKSGTPYLGICVGLQVLFEESDESPGCPGLKVFPGRVVKFTRGKVPQIGWNKIEPVNGSGSAEAGFVYFVNSFFARPADRSVTSYEAEYFERFCAAVQRNNVTAMQFHPEKSGEFGSSLIIEWTKNACK